MIQSIATPRFTIGLPFYRARATLADSVRSIFAQTFGDWELILFADGSTDASAEIVRGIKDRRVQLLVDPIRRGLAWRLNEIAQVAKGSILVRMDADDLSHPDRLTRLDAVFREFPSTEVATSACYCLDANDAVIGTRGGPPRFPTDVKTLLTRGSWIAHPTVATSRVWSLANPYDGSYRRAEDLELWCRVINRATIRPLDAALYFYREEGSTRPRLYAESALAIHRVLGRYGPAAIGYPATLRVQAINAVKIAAVAVITPAQRSDWLLRRRSLPISEAKVREAERVLEEIRSVKVDGILDEK